MQINNTLYANYARLSAGSTAPRQNETVPAPDKQHAITEQSQEKSAGSLPDISHMSEKFQQGVASGQLELVPVSPEVRAAMLAAQEENPTGYENIIEAKQQRLHDVLQSRDMEDPFWVSQADLLRSDIEGYKKQQQHILDAQADSTFSDHAPIAWRIAGYDGQVQSDVLRTPSVSPNESGLLDPRKK